MNQMIKGAAEDFRGSGQRKEGVEVVCTPFEETHVQADRERLGQVLYNLIGNALKFTSEGFVVLSAQRQDSSVIVAVKDDGRGIDKELVPRLFTKFVSKSEKGTGLGLFIAKGIVEAHGGKIWAENNENGMGASFYFSLPLDPELPDSK